MRLQPSVRRATRRADRVRRRRERRDAARRARRAARAHRAPALAPARRRSPSNASRSTDRPALRRAAHPDRKPFGTSCRASAVPRCARRSSRRHTLLYAHGGRFLSALDPPAEAADARRRSSTGTPGRCSVGDEHADSQRSPLVLSSPIILYDFPAVAPQSEGDTFDATEVDELMMLSVLSLSEKSVTRLGRPIRALVRSSNAPNASGPKSWAGCTARCCKRSTMPPQPDPFAALDVPAMDCVFVDGTKSQKVRGPIAPEAPRRRVGSLSRREVATVRAIHQDVENQMYVAVTVDDDPASDLHDWYGRSFFFYPDEVEPMGVAVGSE